MTDAFTPVPSTLFDLSKGDPRLDALKPGDAVVAPRGGEDTIVNMVATDSQGKRYALLTGDGRGVYPTWHSGDTVGSVYYEYVGEPGAALRGIHGWVDSVTRRIVQTG